MSQLSNVVMENARAIGRLAVYAENVENPSPRVVEAMRTIRRAQQQMEEASRLLRKSGL